MSKKTNKIIKLDTKTYIVKVTEIDRLRPSMQSTHSYFCRSIEDVNEVKSDFNSPRYIITVITRD